MKSLRHRVSGFKLLIILSLLTQVVFFDIETTGGEVAVLHHDLHVKLIPEKSYLIAIDTITFPEQVDRLSFFIHKNLDINEITPKGSIKITEIAELKKIDIVFDSPQRSITIRYGGMIHGPVKTVGEQARGYSYTEGIISEEGVFLHGGSFWYPKIEGSLLTFKLSIELPEGWYGISQGEENKAEGSLSWNSPESQEEIYLVANRFIRYEEELDGIKAIVLLRSPDEGLAKNI